ncbi:hypothetical protein RI444_09440 [Paenarthrobacter sp. AT5]|uniref:hypothetical protein n=1 Tax=Paenarthrobacter TaxID=1742992 RepID=UPI001A98744F|nr:MULTISPECIES: hypothetical protein [Paenarthrobacter]QSZ54027.1 hypothetical protein AYX19_14195 [Paenarthrobacter ureafaciens]WOC62816.1 hypothetical protein RI444_09440 [Paenarthrobacter sp. AT5]
MTYVAEARPRKRPTPRKRSLSPLELRLAESKIFRARIDSHHRALLGRRNEAIAAALADKVSATTVATVVGIRVTDVKRLAGAYQDLHFSGAQPEWHLSVLTSVVRQLEQALQDKERSVARLRGDVMEGLGSAGLDIYRVAALTSLPADRIRELLRPAPSHA